MKSDMPYAATITSFLFNFLLSIDGLTSEVERVSVLRLGVNVVSRQAQALFSMGQAM